MERGGCEPACGTRALFADEEVEPAIFLPDDRGTILARHYNSSFPLILLHANRAQYEGSRTDGAPHPQVSTSATMTKGPVTPVHWYSKLNNSCSALGPLPRPATTEVVLATFSSRRSLLQPAIGPSCQAPLGFYSCRCQPCGRGA